MAAEYECVLNNRCGFAESLIHHTNSTLRLKERSPSSGLTRGALSARGINIGYRLQVLERDSDQLEGIFRFRARLRYDRHDWLSRPNHLADG